MKLIIGLGNPGEKYENTRHNVGWLVIDTLKQAISKSEFLISNQIPIPNFQRENKFNAEIIRLGDVILGKPTTFMNESGVAVLKIANFYKIKPDDIYVMHDDLDLRLGDYKIQKGVGPKLHYGIHSIENSIGSKDFLRVRIGVDNRDPENRTSGEQYVLQEFTKEERKAVDRTIEDVVNDLFEHYLQ